MANITTRNVAAGKRNDAGDMVLRTLGNITLTIENMLPTELDEWKWISASLDTKGRDETQFLRTVRGWKAIHPKAGLVGILLQGAGTRVHVEWYDTTTEDFLSAAQVRNVRHGAAAIINARQQAGQGLPADPEPKPVTTPKPVKMRNPLRPVAHRDGTQVRYHGSITQLAGGIYWVMKCDWRDCDCERYQLMGPTTRGGWTPVALHVGPDSVTAIEDAENILNTLRR